MLVVLLENDTAYVWCYTLIVLLICCILEKIVIQGKSCYVLLVLLAKFQFLFEAWILLLHDQVGKARDCGKHAVVFIVMFECNH